MFPTAHPVIINKLNGEAIKGLIVRRGWHHLHLRHAELLAREEQPNGELRVVTRQIDGETIVPRRQVDFVQVLP